MAITLNIELTDDQRTVMEAYAPDGTGAQKKAWAEEVALDGLKLAILGIAKQASREAAIQMRRQAFLDIEDAWADPVEEATPPEGATP